MDGLLVIMFYHKSELVLCTVWCIKCCMIYRAKVNEMSHLWIVQWIYVLHLLHSSCIPLSIKQTIILTPKNYIYQHFVHRELFFRIHKFLNLWESYNTGLWDTSTLHHYIFSSDLNINIKQSAQVIKYLLLNNDWTGNLTITMLSIQMLLVNFLACMSSLFSVGMRTLREDQIIESNQNVMYLDYK